MSKKMRQEEMKKALIHLYLYQVWFLPAIQKSDERQQRASVNVITWRITMIPLSSSCVKCSGFLARDAIPVLDIA